ncbi:MULTISPECIES: TRAP transporter small permease [Fusobacterium]|uniref:TRAP transporter small permease n=1 Tax=Fusobacterium TaxID=848 RepID=UPI000483BE71|nr:MULTISPECIES: TRAP transporter small permease subunit [Fusobacterium]NME35529.1 TRAP transporter small permease subunit [Fusobacterium sp. FSA-380-WT-3A]
MLKLYNKFCKLESLIASILLIGIFFLVFSSAIFRTVGYPINWAQDAALVAFAWMIFLGSDLAIRNTKLIGIEVLTKYFPKLFQKYLDIIFKCIIICFLLILVKYGYVMAITGAKRTITTLGISYAWVTASVPVGAVLMIISTAIRLKESIKISSDKWGENN